MKTTLTAGLSALQGKIGSLAGQQRRSGSAMVLKSSPYSKSGEERSAAQAANMVLYTDARTDFCTAAAEDKARWAAAAKELSISAFNWLVKIEIKSMYDEAEYSFGHYD